MEILDRITTTMARTFVCRLRCTRLLEQRNDIGAGGRGDMDAVPRGWPGEISDMAQHLRSLLIRGDLNPFHALYPPTKGE